MVPPDTEITSEGSEFSRGTQLPDVGGGASSSSSSSLSSNEEQRQQQQPASLFSRHSSSSSTTDECASNADEDLTSSSLSSHQRRVELVPNEVNPAVGAVGGAAWGGVGSNAAAATAAVAAGGDTSAPQRHPKRTLAEEEKTGHGQLLRKACDLCTKRKRKCNGQHPCSQCIETGARNQCIYSPRLKSGRKKKVRIDGVLYEEGGGEGGVYDGTTGGLALVASNGARRGSGGYAVDSAAGRFSASGAVGLAGHVENFFLATYLRDFNRIVPLTSESSVTEGMLEVLSPAVSSRGLSAASPIKQPESRRQAKLAVFWGVVAMGSRILGANDEATARYLGLMRTSLQECFDCNDKEVVQAYLLLSTVETMRGNDEAGKRYLDHAHTMHNGKAMGAEGQLLADRPEQDESLDLVFQIYGQPDGCVGYVSSAVAGGGGGGGGDPQSRGPRVGGHGSPAALNQMIAQAMSPPSEAQSGPLKALKYLSTACGLSSEVFDPTNKCVTVKQYLGEMDSALKGANSLFKHTDLSECITGVVMVKIWGGVTVVMRSWGKHEDKDVGLAQVEEGVGYALTRPGLMTFPMWWHALHCAAVVLAHFGRTDTYMRLRATFNKSTFPGTEMPSVELYSPGAICPQLGGSCSKLAYWLQVRGTMCSEPDWKPQYNSRMSAESENAAYTAALDRKNVCVHQVKENEAYTGTLEATLNPMIAVDIMCGDGGGGGGGDGNCVSVGSLQQQEQKQQEQEPPPDEQALRSALDAGLAEIGGQLIDFGGLDALSGGNDDGLDFDPLGVDFDLSQLPDSENVVVSSAAAPSSSFAPSTVGVSEGITNSSMGIPANLSAQRGTGVVVLTGGGELSRNPSFGISGHAAASTIMAAATASSGMLGGETLSRQSSLDINTIMQMVSCDEELKIKEGGNPDAMDNAVAFGEGPAKEMFGVELSM